MTLNFDKTMAEKTNAELVAVLTEQSKYQPAAVESARKEIERRNINPADFQQITQKVTEMQTKLQELDLKTAPTSARIIHYFVDSACFVFALIPAIILYDLFIGMGNSATDIFASWVIFIVVFIVYFWIMEYKFGKTVGKFLTKTHVVMANGNQPTSKDIFIRTLCRAIPFDSLSFLFMKNGFHDGVSHTTVIKD